jgi:uncharacterized protein YqjF (DUF2071 family)
VNSSELAVLAGLASTRGSSPLPALLDVLRRSGIADASARDALAALLARGQIALTDAHLVLTTPGSIALLDAYAEISAALDHSPPAVDEETCPSIPWLTQVQTEWIEALSINYAVDPDALQTLLPAPLQPEIFEGSAWMQVLMSSLRDMRPQGLGALFGVDFYQVSYRAAVRWRDAEGTWHRGGYFVRSETNHEVMRTVGNALVEFKFHDFGAAQMYLLRDGDRLTAAIDAQVPGGQLFGTFDTRSAAAPSGSVWRDLGHLQHALVECYDAFGIDHDGGWLYTLTIDRDPWHASFATPQQLYCEYVDTGPLGGGAARLDSVLHIPRCAYRWRPLRRVRLP